MRWKNWRKQASNAAGKKEDSFCGSMKKSGVNKGKAKAKDLDPKAKPKT